ncbi:peptidylprolyl isomerase [Akkermansiaceae bacterium]|nr:peptidylprolyl isomerase [Akkermansiaceae bacterium]
MLRVTLLAAFLAAPVQAQIYADFTVSSGGNPLGTFRVLLEHAKAPRTCANFIGLASGRRPWVDVRTGAVRTNRPYYDGLTFHRLIHSFVIQGGSPNGQGTDGPGYSILDEYHPDLRHSSQYVLSMAKAGSPNTGGSQFFITLRATPELDNKHSVFGTVISGTEIIDGFKNPANFPVGAGDKPSTPITMDSVVISGPGYAGFDISAPGLRLPHLAENRIAITRDAALQTMTAVFDRKPQTEYRAFGSPDLVAWADHGIVLSMDGENAFQLTVDSRPEPSYFLRVPAVNYGDVPNAPADLGDGGKTVRIRFGGGDFLDISPNGSGGGTWADNAGGTGTISQTSWTDSAPDTGVFSVSNSSAFFIPLGDFRTTLLNYPGPGENINLATWLSFHTPTSGWTEEIGNGPVNRFAFEILAQ